MFGYVTDEQFAKFQERWEKTNIDNLDSRIVPTVIKLAKHPDLIPVWSCSGHDAKEQEEENPNKKVAMSQKRYIYFVVRQGHTKIFKNFDKYVNNISWDDYLNIHPHLTSFLLGHGFVNKNKDLSTYSVWGIEINYNLRRQSHDNKSAIIPKRIEDLWDNLINSLLEE